MPSGGMPVRGRFAPSPSGRMHLGNVLCSLLAWLSARSQGGTIVLLGNFPEGISPVHTEIAQWGYRPYREVKKLVEDGTLAGDLTLAAHLVHLGRVLDARQAECVLISEGISREEAEQVGFRYLDSPDQIMDYLKRKHGDGVRVLAIPGYNSTPIISSTPQP